MYLSLYARFHWPTMTGFNASLVALLHVSASGFPSLLSCLFSQRIGLSLQDVDVLAYTRGPGLVPCLSVGARAALEIAAELGETGREALQFWIDEGLKYTDDQHGQEREEERVGARRGEAGGTRQEGPRKVSSRAFEVWRKSEQDKTEKEGAHTLRRDPTTGHIPRVWLTPEEREALVFKIVSEASRRKGETDSILEEIRPLVVSINHLHGHVLSAWMNEENEALGQDTPFFTPSSLSPSFPSASRSSSSSPPALSSHPISSSQLSPSRSISSCITPPERLFSHATLSDSSSLSLYDLACEPSEATTQTPPPVYQEAFGSSHSSSCEREKEPRKLPFIVSLLVSGGHTFTSIIRPCQDVRHVHLQPKTFTLHFPLLGDPSKHMRGEGLRPGRSDRNEAEEQERGADSSTGEREDQKGEQQTEGEEKGIAEKRERISRLREEHYIGAGKKTLSDTYSIDVEVWGSWSENEEVYEGRQRHSCVNGLQCTYTGQTEDDAAGEAIDKSMRTLLSVTTPSHPSSKSTSLSSSASVTSTQREGGDQEGEFHISAGSEQREEEQEDETRHLQRVNASRTDGEAFGSSPGGALMEELGSRGDPTFLSLPKMLVYKPKSLNFR